jgi:putative glutamine amidotransferase
MTDRRPLILVSSYYLPHQSNPSRWFFAGAPMAYLDAINMAGGTALIAPPLESTEQCQESLDHCDAVILVGGPDLHPDSCNQKMHPAMDLLHRRRNDSDLMLSREVWNSNKPLLAVCGGMQAMNVARGGNLYQHLPEDFPGISEAESTHRKPDDNMHDIIIEEQSRLAAILQTSKLEVNSAHHQSVKEVAEGLTVSARSEAGLIEALEGLDPQRFMLLLQWHPEQLAVKPLRNDIGAPPQPGRDDQLNIFKALVTAATG